MRWKRVTTQTVLGTTGVCLCVSRSSMDTRVLPRGCCVFLLFTCGDGTVTAGEGCDDGNRVSGDGCKRDCTVEPGYACNGSPTSVCVWRSACVETALLILRAVRRATQAKWPRRGGWTVPWSPGGSVLSRAQPAFGATARLSSC